MDNFSRHYKRIYEQALKFAGEDNDACLQICWRLRADPKIGIYRRALVNLLIASALPKTGNSEKYTVECLDFLHLLRQEQPWMNDEDEQELVEIEEAARGLRKGIAEEKSKTEGGQEQKTDPLGRDETIIWQSQPPSAELCARVMKQAAEAPKIEGYLRDKYHVPIPTEAPDMQPEQQHRELIFRESDSSKAIHHPTLAPSSPPRKLE